MARRASEAAYFVVNLNELEPSFRQQVLEDAEVGGMEFGVRVVEEIHNGPARSAIYGVYKTVQDGDGKVLSDDEGKWNAAKAEYNVPDSVDDDKAAETAATTAADAAAAEADRVREAEEAEQRRITKEDPKNKLK